MPVPIITYPPELPVSAAREEIAAAISANQVVIVAGATGSGKTTQLPKICLDLGRERIAHTQPRRLAARTIAERIAEELRVPIGGLVGYKVRFTDQVSAETRIALMTDGILLNEIHRDRLLSRYDTIIIDEAHERSLNVDFLLGYLHRILPERPDLKIIITSATIDPQSFARHFATPTRGQDQPAIPAPIIEVSGRTFPVEIRYRSRVADQGADPADAEVDAEVDEVSAIVGALRELDREAPGDVLVFLPGEAEIRDAADAVRTAYASETLPTEVLPLYGRLSSADQHRVFEPSRVAGLRRRVILATNVAETSLTVPGIKYVVDTGTARISRYSNRSKVQQLPIEAISQASANQRSGRAGRTSDGIAIRLYSEEDFDSRAAYTEPEILRTSLASVVLQMLALGFGDISDFPFLTPPDSRGVKAAFDLLLELGAITLAKGAPRLTQTGRDIARMPIDPRFARMLIEALRLGVSGDVTAIVAGLSIQDVRERPAADATPALRDAAERSHARFTDPTSDFMALLNLWNYLQEQHGLLGSSAFRRLCRSEHLNYVRVREWFDVHRQLRTLVKPKKSSDGENQKSGAADPDTVHRAILSGLLSHLGLLDERTVAARGAATPKKGADKRKGVEYRGSRGIRFSIFPGSGLRKQAPPAVMAAEIVETSRTFARTVARIDPAWAESLAGDLAKRQVSEPHWSKASGAAIAYEKVLLFGLEIVPRRRFQFARVDRAGARELFVRHALVEGEWEPGRIDKRITAFWRDNASLRQRLEQQEERQRRRDILAGDEAVFEFYNRHIPQEVYDVRSFERWWREALLTTPKLLTMQESDLLDEQAAAQGQEFPAQWAQVDQVIALRYRFEPGAADDGVSAVIPLALLQQIKPIGFDWQVPGLRAELITALLRALPKTIRRHVVPAADWAQKFGAELAASAPELHGGLPQASLAQSLARLVQPLANQPVSEHDFDLDRVPAHLLINFQVLDDRRRPLGISRDLAQLQRDLATRSQESVARSLAGIGGAANQPKKPAGSSPSANPRIAAAANISEQTGLTDWSFGDLPEVRDTAVAGGVVRGYPALVDAGKSVTLRIEATAESARIATRSGVCRLILLNVASPSSYIQQHLTSTEKLSLAASPYSNAASLIEDGRTAVVQAIIDRNTPADAPGIVRSGSDFARVRDAVSASIVDELFAAVSLVARILQLHREVEKGIKSHNSLTLLGTLGDIRTQLDGLIFPGFISATGTAQLQHFPRYLQGILERLQVLGDAPGKDRTRMNEYQRAEISFADAGGRIPLSAVGVVPPPANLVAARWLLEEYRVSVFAQKLGTAQPVSLQRITKLLGTAG